ncbi:hypothetical protein BIFDEN_01879 [Bifidobacterium dentium ATCC 27678]|nr:hypothetical protein BIFDEN_01879 [Bifidobacterium dentium ATCC 27678]
MHANALGIPDLIRQIGDFQLLRRFIVPAVRSVHNMNGSPLLHFVPRNVATPIFRAIMEGIRHLETFS